MSTKVTCSECGKLLSIPDEYYELSVKCPVCGNKFKPSETEAARGRETDVHRAPRRSTTRIPPPMHHGARSRPSKSKYFLPPPRRRRPPPMSAGKKQLLSAIGKLKGEDAAAQADLARATKIQFNLLPDRIPSIRGFDMKVHYHSAKEIGGDYYDFIPIDHENLGIVVADVSGKGVPAGMIMTMARTALRLLARGNASARDTMIKVNKFMARDIKNVMFLTVLYMVLNIRTTTLQVVNCGHNPLILWRDNNYRLVNPQGIAIGLDLGPIFERTFKEDLIQIQPGDRIVAYTDGVVESMNERQEEFGEEAFLEMVADCGDKSSAEFLNTLVNALTEHQGPATQHDDITVVTFKFG